jgi:hypothetical protein
MNEILSSGIKDSFRVTVEDRVKASASSKGNQIKWRRSDGIWAKADDLGYEGLAEETASRLLARSNFEPYVIYTACQICEEENIYTGCVSADFLGPGESLMTLARLFQADGLRYDNDMETMTAFERLQYLVEHTERITGMKNFGKWLGMLLEFDCFILNEDRHLNNIAVVQKVDGTFTPMPVFDNGAALLSDTLRDYPMGMPTTIGIRKVKSKPIATSFEKQLAAVRELVGISLRFDCTPEQMVEEVDSFEYSSQIVSRVKDILSHQARRYPYLFPTR